MVKEALVFPRTDKLFGAGSPAFASLRRTPLPHHLLCLVTLTPRDTVVVRTTLLLTYDFRFRLTSLPGTTVFTFKVAFPIGTTGRSARTLEGLKTLPCRRNTGLLSVFVLPSFTVC